MPQKTISPWERRAIQQENIAALGIDEAYIAVLVDTFYGHIRKHKTLGPIFNNAIQSNWDKHLDRMKDFWSSLVLQSKRYSGNPMALHKKQTAIEKQHFEQWLTLFQQTLIDTAPNDDVVSFFMSRAERIADNLQFAMFRQPLIQN